ncbi:hypothetical protein NDU88_010071 [Pleurodeles waltl]|uniref:Uncharacterized protein n=1 Tax=Pleurodeles waltl TaxID=8319 RepID=A0AAV7QTE0_PLEWA|nr:hypothetical protein NDU88_010071 [Pleurodeles waltl]
MGPVLKGQDDRPRPIIACFLHHEQVRHLLTAARAHGPYDFEDWELQSAPDFSRDTNDKQRECLALQPQLRQMNIKFGLFEPARMWITKDGKYKDFYDLQALRQFLDNLLQQPMHFSPNATRPLHVSKRYLFTHNPSGTVGALAELSIKNGQTC